MKIPIDLKLRRCIRCKHWECTHCRNFCDHHDCIFENGPCEDGECVYDTPRDEEGYKRFHAKMEELADDPSLPGCLTWLNHRVGDQVQEDGTVVILVDEPNEPEPPEAA